MYGFQSHGNFEFAFHHIPKRKTGRGTEFGMIFYNNPIKRCHKLGNGRPVGYRNGLLVKKIAAVVEFDLRGCRQLAPFKFF